MKCGTTEMSYVSFPREVREFSTKVKIRISGLKR